MYPFAITLFSSIVLLTSPVWLQGQGLTGHWQGKAIEPGRSDWYQVEIVINPGMEPAGSARIYYADYRCGGTLLLSTMNDAGETAIYTEYIHEGVERCINFGVVTLHLKEDQLIYQWSHEDWSHEATGILRRID